MVGQTNSQRYRWLLFDADGTLFDYDRAERAALAGALQQKRQWPKDLVLLPALEPAELPKRSYQPRSDRCSKSACA